MNRQVGSELHQRGVERRGGEGTEQGDQSVADMVVYGK